MTHIHIVNSSILHEKIFLFFTTIANRKEKRRQNKLEGEQNEGEKVSSYFVDSSSFGDATEETANF